MALSRLKAARQLRAVKTFTDREDSRSAFARCLDEYLSGETPFRVLNFYGVGGIGKSALLRELQSSTTCLAHMRVVCVDIEAPQFNSPHDILLDVWRQLRADCPRFEYGLTRVLSVEGRSLRDLQPGLFHKDSLLYDLQELASDIADVVAPARLIRKLIEIGGEKRRRHLSSLREAFDEIDAIPDSELPDYLPHLFGEDLAAWLAASNTKAIFFLDTVDALRIQSHFRSTKRDADGWLQEFIGSAETGLFVLAGRDILKWADGNPEWLPFVEQHVLGHLSDTDANYFLERIPVTEPAIREAIIESSKGVPLFLDLCANTYIARQRANEALLPQDFRTNEMEVIRRFLAHLDIEHQEALRAVAILERFDKALFAAMMRELHISFPLALYPAFCEGSYAIAVRPQEGIYRIHDVVRGYIADEASPETAEHVRDAIAAQLASAKGTSGADRASWLFAQLCIVASKYKLRWPAQVVDRIVEAGLSLIDAGRWNTVHAALERLQARLDAFPAATTGEDGDERFEAALLLLRAYARRKRGELTQAAGDYRRIAGREAALGRRTALYKYLSAHTDHLLGDYGSALKTYLELCADGTAGGAEVEALARRQCADLQMLKGRFREALTGFLRAQDDMPDDPIWQAETFRFRGHVHRFNFHLGEAEAMYHEALQIARWHRAEAMEGKILTNLAETLCWLAPRAALDHAAQSIELNAEVTAPIEVGKAHAARGIALALDGALDQARQSSDEAIRIHTACGYRAGVLFGLQARGIAQRLSGDARGVRETREEMAALSAQVGVYPFLDWVLGAEPAERREADGDLCQWLDFPATATAVAAILAGARHGAGA